MMRASSQPAWTCFIATFVHMYKYDYIHLRHATTNLEYHSKAFAGLSSFVTLLRNPRTWIPSVYSHQKSSGKEEQDLHRDRPTG